MFEGKRVILDSDWLCHRIIALMCFVAFGGGMPSIPNALLVVCVH